MQICSLPKVCSLKKKSLRLSAIMSTSLLRRQPRAVKVTVTAWDTAAVVQALGPIQAVTGLHSSTSDALSSKFLQGLHQLYVADDLPSVCFQLFLLMYNLSSGMSGVAPCCAL